MIVTRTERYTDWVYQGALAGETAATVGIGLLEGHIYYQYSHDHLNAGDVILREKSFVHLSDGSEYELGTGASSEKVDITYHGQASDGSVQIDVKGRPDLGVGVQSIQRVITISYDDGKVPVLDTDQLKGILAELSDNLTSGMESTAEAVKEELRQEVANALVDGKAYADTIKSTVDASLESHKTTLDSRMDSISSDLVTLSTKVEEGLQGVTESISKDLPQAAKWTVGTYQVNNRQLNNILSYPPSLAEGSGAFTHSSLMRSMVLDKEYITRDRMLTITACLQFETPNDYAGFLSVLTRKSGEQTNLARASLYVQHDVITQEYIQFTLKVFIPLAEKDTHPVVTNGLTMGVHQINNIDLNARVKEGSYILYQLD